MPRLKWHTWLGIFGVLGVLWGTAWIAIWSHIVQSDPNMYWLTLELKPPLEARVMVLAGAISLVVALVAGLLHKVARKNAMKNLSNS